jgi:hypothetical protein
MSFNTATLAELRIARDRAKETARRFKERYGKKIAIGFHAAETGGVAYAFGFLNGRFGGEENEMSIGGVVPVDLVAAGLLHGVAFFGGLDESDAPHVHALGNGALAACGYRYGSRLGERMAVEAGAKAPRAIAGSQSLPQLGGNQRVVATPAGQQYTVTQHP